MTSSRVFAVCATLLVLGMPLTAGADPGDPRLVSGVLEWPVVATSTPFVIIRGDNGVLYYVSVAAARRAGAVKAGARVSVLGIEGPNAHEIRAVGMGSGPTAEAALADLQAAPAPPAVAPAPLGPHQLLPRLRRPRPDRRAPLRRPWRPHRQPPRRRPQRSHRQPPSQSPRQRRQHRQRRRRLRPHRRVR